MKVLICNYSSSVLEVDPVNLDAVTSGEAMLMTWYGNTPEVGDILHGNKFVKPWYARSSEAKLVEIRNARNKKFRNTEWLVERHREELELNKTTTLSAEEYSELLNYRQALRDFPENVDLNAETFEFIEWPPVPMFI